MQNIFRFLVVAFISVLVSYHNDANAFVQNHLLVDSINQEVGASTIVPTGRIPDTGQIKCYNDSGEITCPTEGQEFYGQDGCYTINTPSYTKLGYNGIELGVDATYPEWIMTRDNVTGLIWEMKTGKDGVTNYTDPHDADNTYTWYDSNPETNGGNAGTPGEETDTEDFIKALNDANYGGHRDWRLPTINELASIVDHSIPYPGPTIHATYFSNTAASEHWSSTTSANSTNGAWNVSFDYGDGGFGSKSYSRYVRAVRGGEQSGSFDNLGVGLFDAEENQTIQNSSNVGCGLVNNEDGTVTDSFTGLMWQNEISDNVMVWKDALAHCEELPQGEYMDWRLPTIEELRSLVDYTRYSPAINIDFFLNTGYATASRYWSSTTLANSTINALGVDFYYGRENPSPKGSTSYVRAVRGGQNRLLGHLFILAPAQAAFLSIGTSTQIQWETSGISGNVAITLSRDGGKAWETIIASTPNDGIHPWTVTGPASVNCILKIEPLGDPSKGTIQGLFTVYESGTPTCTYSIDPPSKTFEATGGSQDVMVTTNSSTCAWTVSGSLDWITVSKTGSTGSGSVTVTALANSGAVRSGTVTIAGQSFGVSQDGVSSTFVPTGQIPDTGQTKCYNDSGEITCPTEGQELHGQDGCYTINTPSYTKLGYNGIELGVDATYPEWIMTRDNVTGLIWEMKTGKDGITNYNDPHDADNTYTWYDSNPETNGGNAGTPREGTDTEDFIKALNDANYGGHRDWRLPTIKELGYIVDRSIPSPGPAIHAAYFPNTAASLYWSSTTYTYYKGHAWYVTFSNGHHSTSNKFNYLYVRAVRGGQFGTFGNSVIGSFDSVNNDDIQSTMPAGGFKDNEDDTVTDSSTGLMWQQETPDTTMNWKAALANSEGLPLGGYADWRLPNINELRSLVNYNTYDPTIDISKFLDTASSCYWSSTPSSSYAANAWAVSFGVGNDDYGSKINSYYVRAVRGGQNRLLGHLFILAPAQAAFLSIGTSTQIQWETSGISGNVAITLSRDGGKAWETIIASTPNDGNHPWTVTGPASVNCMLKIEPLGDPTKGTIQGLFTVYESGTPTCTYTIDPPSKTFAASGDSQSVAVTASSSTCAWAVSESLDWITVSKTNGTGTGTVTVTAFANTGAARSGTVTIAGQNFSVSQYGVTVPGAPTIGTATAGNASASVTFTAPSNTGGSDITGYTVTASPGGLIGTGTASPVTVSGLTNGTAYTFKVKATNAVGTGPESAASNSVTPRTVPGAPTIGTATAGNASASVTFTPPTNTGGSDIMGYTVTVSPGGLTGTGTTSPVTVWGLTNGTAYTFKVKATNAVGTGPESAASNSVTPRTVPGAPTIGTATAGNASASVTFTPPTNTGGSDIIGYTVTA
ncbi:MAG: DUF1566 domain-containing protein, partial [Desulfatirhabdiaceae bacterium]